MSGNGAQHLRHQVRDRLHVAQCRVRAAFGRPARCKKTSNAVWTTSSCNSANRLHSSQHEHPSGAPRRGYAFAGTAVGNERRYRVQHQSGTRLLVANPRNSESDEWISHHQLYRRNEVLPIAYSLRFLAETGQPSCRRKSSFVSTSSKRRSDFTPPSVLPLVSKAEG